MASSSNKSKEYKQTPRNPKEDCSTSRRKSREEYFTLSPSEFNACSNTKNFD